MSAISAISGTIAQGATTAAKRTIQANAAQIATGQAAAATSAGFFGTLAYLGQALKNGLSLGGNSYGVEALSAPVIKSGILSTIGLGTIAAGDLLTAGAAGASIYSLNSLTKISTGTSLLGLASASARGIGNAFASVFNAGKSLFSRGTQVAQNGLKLVA